MNPRLPAAKPRCQRFAEFQAQHGGIKVMTEEIADRRRAEIPEIAP